MRPFRITTLAALLLASPSTLAAQDRSAVQQSAREILRELIGINTDGDSGSTTAAAQALAKRLIAAGFPFYFHWKRRKAG